MALQQQQQQQLQHQQQDLQLPHNDYMELTPLQIQCRNQPQHTTTPAANTSTYQSILFGLNNMSRGRFLCVIIALTVLGLVSNFSNVINDVTNNDKFRHWLKKQMFNFSSIDTNN